MFNNIAIIAGSGKLPFKIASYLKKFNANFIILAIKGYSKINLYKNFKTYSLRMGEGYKAIKILKENKMERSKGVHRNKNHTVSLIKFLAINRCNP